MIADIAMHSNFLEIWGDRMFAASWQGGLLLALAWLICRFWKRFPASTRCWIWRIAYFKFALVLLLGGFLQLPILPGSIKNNNSIANSKGKEPTSSQRVADATNVDYAIELTSEFNRRPAEVPLRSNDRLPVNNKKWINNTFLFVIWIVGCAFCLFNVIRQQMFARKLLAKSSPLVNEQFQSYYRVLSSQLKLSNPPKVATSSAIKSPILVGAIKPTILIPESVIRSFGLDELRLIVAHELAHSKRCDLMWNWLPVLVRTGFFFHPLVWIAQSRLALDQEIACDFLALNCTRVRCQHYANVLVKVSSGMSSQRPPTLAAIGVASSFKTLKSRILEMSQFNYQTSRATQLLSMTIVAIGLFLIAPIDLVARQKNSIRKKTDVQNDQQTEEQGRESLRSVGSRAGTSGNNETKVASEQEGQIGNISISVNDGDVTESIQIRSNKNGEVEVTYTNDTEGSIEIKKYKLERIEKLAEKNKRAYELYKSHVTASSNNSNGDGLRITSETVTGSRAGRSRSRSKSPTTSPATGSNVIADPARDSSSQSSTSSASQSSLSIGRNGQTRSTQTSKTTGDGLVGGGNSNRQLVERINQMIDQTTDAQMKNSLRQLLDQIKNR